MKFSAGLPTERVQYGSEFIGRKAIAEMAHTLESSGFDACYVTDHPFPPDAWLGSGGHHALDPFVSLAFVAGETTTLRLHTNIMVLPYRNPFLAAKTVLTLDVLSEGRVILGVAAGYLEAEFKALGIPFERRNELADEALTAMKRAWTESGVEFRGHNFEATGNTMLPRPLQQPHPPIWVGGNSKRAIHRAVEMAEGWIPFQNPPQLAAHTRSAVVEGIGDLRAKIEISRGHAAKVGRSHPLEICFGVSAFTKQVLEAQRAIDALGALAEAGVTWSTIRIPGRTRSEYCENAARFAADVITPIRSRR